MTDIATLSVKITADAKALDAALKRAQGQLEAFGRGTGQGAGALDKASIAAQRLAQEQAKAALAAQRVATEQQRTVSATKNAEAAATRLAAAQERAAAAVQRSASGVAILPRTFAGLSDSAAAFATQLTGAFAVGSVANFLAQAGAAANALEKTEATLRAVAGSQSRYNEVVRIAEGNQKLFGGTLNDNLQPLQQFLFIANRTGASLDELNKAAQLLSVINPAEGFQGAGVALSEFFSGDVTSIVERFNLPRQAIRELTDESLTSQQKLAGLFDLLAQQGVTAETLAASLDTNAAAYDRLGAAASTAFTNIGRDASAAFAPVANFITAGIDGFNRLVAAAGQAEAAALAAATGSANYDEYLVRIRGVNEALTEIGQIQPELTAAQYTYFQALQAGGVAVEEAAAQARNYGVELVDLGNGETIAQESAGALAQAQALLAENTRLAALSTADAAVEIEVAAASMDLAAAAAAAEEAALKDATAAAYEQANAGADLEAQARAAADALIASGNAGAAAAERLGNSTSPIDRLTAAYYRLAAAQQAAGKGTGALGNLGTLVGKGAGDATATIRALNREYGAGPLGALGGGGGGTKPPRGGRGGGGGGGGTSPAAKAAEKEAKAVEAQQQKLADISERAYEARLAAEERYQESLLAVQARYNEAQLQAQRDLQAESAGSRADFYDSLTQTDLPPDIQQSLSAAYEAAFAEAQRLSQEGKAALAGDYLDLKQQQIAAEQKFQEAVAAAKEKGDKAEIARLEAIKKLRDAEFAARESNLMAEGDANTTARDEGVADAEATRQKAIEDAAVKAGDALEDAQKRTKDAALLTNEALQKQIELLGKTGGLPASAPAAATTTATADAATAAPAGAAAPGGDALAVRDVDALAALQAVAGQLENIARALRSRPNYSPGG